VNISDFKANVNISYEYISDPPVFADFGNVTIDIDDFNLYSKTTF